MSKLQPLTSPNKSKFGRCEVLRRRWSCTKLPDLNEIKEGYMTCRVFKTIRPAVFADWMNYFIHNCLFFLIYT